MNFTPELSLLHKYIYIVNIQLDLYMLHMKTWKFKDMYYAGYYEHKYD